MAETKEIKSAESNNAITLSYHLPEFTLAINQPQNSSYPYLEHGTDTAR
jgi:hypothetical protein